MYPFVRMIKEVLLAGSAPPLEPFDTHVSHHICWPWDLDLWMELNNGRSLTLFDLGRYPMARRMGLMKALAKNGWGLTMAGCSVRWRARVRAFERVEIRSRAIGADDKFMYLDQSMWKRDGTCASQALYRTAAFGKEGIVSPKRVREAMGMSEEVPELPQWVQAWINAEDSRPWPPVGPAS